MTDVTQILSQIESGDPSAAEQLLPLVYEELRKLAAAKLTQEKPGQTLQATALVHVRLAGENRQEPGCCCRNQHVSVDFSAIINSYVKQLEGGCPGPKASTQASIPNVKPVELKTKKGRGTCRAVQCFRTHSFAASPLGGRLSFHP